MEKFDSFTVVSQIDIRKFILIIDCLIIFNNMTNKECEIIKLELYFDILT